VINFGYDLDCSTPYTAFNKINPPYTDVTCEEKKLTIHGMFQDFSHESDALIWFDIPYMA